MRLRVIATDYDGTVATDGQLHPDVRAAIRAARQRGVLVVIVTGRILSELRDVTGGLDFVDGVVAENGAVISMAGGHTMQLGPPPPMSLITALTKRGIDFKVGRCVVEMDAGFADVAMSLIREQELPLAITFNRQRMMLLPASISKCSGLRELLGALGVSRHNTLGIGDAENDHELLRCCEYGVAVEWGSDYLKQHADEVICGEGPRDVGVYIQQVSKSICIPLEHGSHHKIVLEAIEGQTPFEVVIRGRNILIAGDTQSGKSWLAGLLVEQMIFQGYTVYVFDPEGDYSSLGTLPNTVVMGGGRMLPEGDDLLMFLHQGLSVVLNLSHLDHEQKSKYVQDHLPLVAKFRRQRGFPHRILIDESHYFLNAASSSMLLDLDLGAYTLVTWRPSELGASVLQSIDITAVTRLAEKSEVDALAQLAGESTDPARWYEQLANLAINEAALLPPATESNGAPRRFHVAPRLTQHVRHCTKYLDSPVSAEKAFVFSEGGTPVGPVASTFCELQSGIDQCSLSVIQGHLSRHDFSRWIGHVFGDNEFASVVRMLETKHQSSDSILAFRDELASVTEDHYQPDSQGASIQ